MSGRAPSFTGKLLRLVGEVTLVAAATALASGTSQTSPSRPIKTSDPKALRREIITYGVGYAAALALTLAAFALVHWHLAPLPTALWIVFGLALVQIIVHFRCFLHVTLHGPARDDLQLILFSTLIILLMVGGTLVIIFNLRTRMM